MATLGAIVGESGSGKSSAIRNLDPNETFIINVAKKPLPFRGFKKKYKQLAIVDKKYVGNIYNTSSVDQIAKTLNIVDKGMPHIKQILIDDAQYIMSFEAMARAEEKSYDKFTEIAKHFYSILEKSVALRDDLKVFIITHSENSGDIINPKYKIKTVGKMLDNLITLEGLFTYVLYTKVIDNPEGEGFKYVIETQTDGTTTAKSPMGCLEELQIDNDLQIVFDAIDDYE